MFCQGRGQPAFSRSEVTYKVERAQQVPQCSRQRSTGYPHPEYQDEQRVEQDVGQCPQQVGGHRLAGRSFRPDDVSKRGRKDDCRGGYRGDGEVLAGKRSGLFRDAEKGEQLSDTCQQYRCVQSAAGQRQQQAAACNFPFASFFFTQPSCDDCASAAPDQRTKDALDSDGRGNQ